MMDAILSGEKVNMQIGNRHYTFDKPVKSMVNGKEYHDMAQYEAHLKESGHEIVGNDSSLYKDQSGNDVRDWETLDKQQKKKQREREAKAYANE